MDSRQRKWTILLMVLPFLLGVPADGLSAQATAAVRGTVTGPDGNPVGGAQVTIVGTQRGTATATDGTFEITGLGAGERDVRVTFIGFRTETQSVTLAAGQTATVSFQLREAVLDMDAIVVTGVAGEASRRNLPFTVDRLSQAQLPVPATDAGHMLMGKVAGAMVASPSGRPGTAPSILLRGPTSINSAGRDQDPLYIVDGVILSSSIVDIDAMDIESIEVVRGAAAASLYGSRAANGVINITTQRGQGVAQDNVRYTLRNEFGTSQLPGRFNLTDRHHFAMTDDGRFVDTGGNACEWIHCNSIELAGQRALPGQDPDSWNTIQDRAWPGVTYDHVDRFFEDGSFMTNYVAAAGRSGGANYHISYNRQNDGGIMPFHKGSLRHNFRVNVDQSVRPNLTVSASAYFARTRLQLQQGNMFQLTRMPAGVDLMQPDPNVEGAIIVKPDPFNDNINPLYTMSTTQNIEQRSRYLGSINARWTPLDWFDLDTQVSYDRLDTMGQNFRPKGFLNINTVEQGGSMSRASNYNEGINASITGTFRRTFGDLQTTAQMRYLVEREDVTAHSLGGTDFVADGVWTLSNIPNANITGGSSLSATRADGAFFITNFLYRDRYTLNALIRQDGSSRFGPGERRHIYHRIAGAYLISEEDWFNVRGLDELNLRYSLGTAGNTPNFAAQYETYSVSAGSITPVNLGNRNLKPEQATEQEFGFDAYLAGGRLSAELTYATSEITDQLLQVPSLAFTGFQQQWQNAGTLESNTIEATLNSVILRRPNFSWNARLLFDRTRQEITRLDVPDYQTGVGGQGLGNVFYIREGETLGTFYGFQFAEHCGHLPEGVDCSQFQVNDDGFLVWVGDAGSWQNGWDTYIDEEGQERQWWGSAAPFDIRGQELLWGTPFQGEDFDRVSGERTTFLPLGNTTPNYTIGLSNTVTWGNFTAYGLLQSMQGFKVYNQPLQWAVFQNYAGIMNEHGTPENDKKPVGYYDEIYGASGLMPSSAFVDDASFVKLRELSVRYRAGRDVLDRIPGGHAMEAITLSLVGRNLLTWTDYDGYDPDVGSAGGGIGSAALARVDGFSYPNFRTFTLGVELNF
jgi:TonB-linked SusC/RagA family outer membrane protein